MASSPGVNGHSAEEQFSHLRNNNNTDNNSNLNHNNHITNGSSRGVRFQQNQDAIVPASDQDDNDDDSTDEDEAYNSYMQEQEQQQQHQQQIKHNLGLTRQLQPHYGSVGSGDQDMTDEDEDDDDYANHRQHQQQQPHHHQHQQLRQIQQQYQLQQQQHLDAYKSQAMNIQQLLRQDQSHDHDMAGTDSHEEDEYYQQNPHHDPHLQHQMDIDMQRSHHDDLSEDIEDDDDDFDDDVEDDEVDEEMMDEEDDDEGSEAISLTEDDIDFNLVYAFHTFVATQEGQASVVRNDSLMLLEDANVYWWLVRVLKTGVIGYIPAENIETPFERLARLNTYRNVSLTAPSPEWGTFDEHIQPLDPAILEQRAANRRSVVFTAQNEFLEASETEWTDEEDEEGGWYGDGGEEGEEDEEEEEEGSAEDNEDEHESIVEDAIHGAATSIDIASTHKDDSNDNQGYGDSSVKSELQLEAERVQQEILSEQRKHEEMRAMKAMEKEQEYNRQAQQASAEDEDNESEDEEVQVTNRYRKPLLDEDDLLFSSEKRVISLTPPIARDDNLIHRESPSKVRNLRFSGETTPRHSPQPSQQLQQSPSQQQRQASPLTTVRSPSIDSEEEEREKMKKSMAERKEAKISAILGNGPQEPIVRKSKEEYERGLPPEAVVVKKPGKFKSLFSVGKSSKDKERKEKERLEKERLKNLVKSSASTATAAGTNSNNSGISNNLFRARSNSNGSVGSSSTAPSTTANPLSPTIVKKEEPQQDFMTLRVYPGNVDFGASMYKTVVITPATMSSDVAHQAVVKFRLAPDGTASTGDFYLTVKGVDGDETVLQATDKPMAIYQSLTAHLTTPLPANHRLSISSVSSMMSVNSTGSQSSSSNPTAPGTPTLRRTGSGRAEPQQRSIRFLLNKKIKRAGSVSLAGSSIPSTPTTPTTPQEDFFWVKVVCQAQDLPQSMVLLEGMGSAIEKADSRTHGQSFATKVEHWIPMHSTSNAGDVIFKTLEKVGIRSGVVDGVPEHVLVAKRLAVPHGLVIEYQLGLKLASGTTKKFKQGEEISLPPQVPLAKCFEDHQLQPIRRSPKADVASMPLHPEYVFFVRKATKSLQAEMKFVQERLQQTQARSRVSSTLQTSQAGRTSVDTVDSQASGIVSPTSSGFPGRNSIGQREASTAAATVNAAAAGRLTGSTSPPIRIPRRTDSVIMSPTSTPIRANSFDNSSGRPSPTLSAQNMMTTQQIHPPQISRTPTPDRHQQVRTRSPSISQGSPTALARPLQAPSPAPSNLSSHGEQQEGSRSSTPERAAKIDRPERQRAISPSLTHGPSPLSMSAIMLPSDSSNSTVTLRKESSTTSEEPSTPTLSSSPSPANRLSVKKNATQGVDILLQKGIVRSSRSQGQYHYQFIPFGGGEEIDITEIIEDVLGGDSDNEDEDDDDESHNHSHNQHVDQNPGQEQDFASMSRRERVAAAVARASQAVAAGKERRRAIAKARPASGSGVSLRSSPSRDWDRLEQLSGSARGGETLLKLERALAAEAVAVSSSSEGPCSRNLPSPMSLTSSSPSSPTLNRRISDAEVQIASVTTMGQNNGLPGSVRNYSPIPQVVTKEGDLNSRAHSPGRSSPSTPTSGYVRPTLLANLSSLPNSRGTNSNPSSPSSVVAPHLHPIEGRSYSPLPRPLQTPSPAALPHQLSIRTSLASSSSADATSPSTDESSATSPLGPLPQFTTTNNNVNRTRSASASVAEGGFRKGGHGVSASESAVSLSHNQHDPWLLASDYNTGMQDLLTLVRGGRSSSVSTSAPSSLRGGLTFGKDGKIVQGPMSPTHHSRHRKFSSQANSPTVSSSFLLYNNTSSTSTTNHHHYHKDTPAHDRHLDDTTTTTTSSGTTSANHNDHVYMTTNNYNTIDGAAADDEVEQNEGLDDDEPRIWIRTDRRLRDVRSECHPEVFECWREVDADLDKVERQLDSLLATVKAAIF